MIFPGHETDFPLDLRKGVEAMASAPPREPRPGITGRALDYLQSKIPGKNTFAYELAKYLSPHIAGQPTAESGLSERAMERAVVTPALEYHARTQAFGEGAETWLPKMKALLRDTPILRQIPWALEMGDRLTPEEQTAYQEHQADIDRLVDGIKKVTAAARDLTGPDGKPLLNIESEGPYSPTQRVYASMLGENFPEFIQRRGSGGGQPGKTKVNATMRRFHDAPGEYNAVDAVGRLIDQVVDRQVRQPEIDEFKSQFEALKNADDAPATAEAQAIFQQWSDQVIHNRRSIEERMLKSKELAHVADSSIHVGESFPFQALDQARAPYGPPKGLVRIDAEVPQENGPPRFEISSRPEGSQEWVKQRAPVTFMDLIAMKNEAALIKPSMKTLIAEGLNTLASTSYLGFRLMSLPVAGISNFARLVASPSAGKFVQGSQKALLTATKALTQKLLGNEEALNDTLREYRRVGLLESHVADAYHSLGKSRPMQVASAIAFATSQIPDLIQKPLAYEMAKLRLAEENPEWSTSRIETQAVKETMTFSDMAGRAGDPLAAKSPMNKLFYLFQKSSARQLTLLASKVGQANLSTPEGRSAMRQAAALVGIPMATWAAIMYATEPDPDKIQENPGKFLLKVARRANDWTPFSYTLSGLPGPEAAWDLVSGKTYGEEVKSAHRYGILRGEE